MARRLKRIRVTPVSEVAKLLEAASAAPVLLEKDGEVYRLNREEGEESIWTGYDPAGVRSALQKTAGTWADLDVEELVGELDRAREEGSRPASRP